MNTSNTRRGVFISYSHEDKKWLERLKMFLKPTLLQEVIWDDTQIRPGAKWADEIEHAIESARVAVLLVTPTFLSSDFIVSKELPRIIERQTKEGLSIFWIAIEPALYEHSLLFEYQAANDVSRPLSTLSKAKQDAELVKITEKIIAAVNVNAVANMLKKVDVFEPQLRAFVEQSPVTPPSHGVIAHQEPGQDVITVGIERITGDDLAKLDPQSKQLIRAYEYAMNDLFDRFTELEPKRTARDPGVRERARLESENVRQDICDTWNKILSYLAFLGKHLEDHYQHVRFICQQSISSH